MKIMPAVLFVFFAGLGLALHACTLLTYPIATAAIGGAQLAIKGAELQKEIRKADAQEAIDVSFEKTWSGSVIALVNLDIEIIGSKRSPQEDGGSIEGLAGKTKVKIVAVKVTVKITEIGIWASHDKALAGLIAERIKEEAQKQDNQNESADPAQGNVTDYGQGKTEAGAGGRHRCHRHPGAIVKIREKPGCEGSGDHLYAHIRSGRASHVL